MLTEKQELTLQWVALATKKNHLLYHRSHICIANQFAVGFDGQRMHAAKVSLPSGWYDSTSLRRKDFPGVHLFYPPTGVFRPLPDSTKEHLLVNSTYVRQAVAVFHNCELYKNHKGVIAGSHDLGLFCIYTI